MLSGRATEGLNIWKNFKAMGIWARATVLLELNFFYK
jgi:hypothetical protein